MRTHGHALSRMSAALLIATLLAGCGDMVTNATTTRQFKPAMSRVAVPTSGQHVFLMKGNISPDFASRVAAAGGMIVSSMDEIGVVVTSGLSDTDASALAGNNDVARDYEGLWVSPDELQVSALSSATEINATARSPFAAAFLPFQWNMFQIHAPDAWATQAPTNPVRVAILDSGLDPDHLDQRGLIDVASSTAFVASTKGPPAWADDFFHGTFVGSIVTSNNVGVAGVVPNNVKLVAVKVLNQNGSGSIGNVIAGIVYATNQKVQVINMSLGLGFPKNVKGASTVLSAFNRALTYAHKSGVVVVSASGNDALDLQHDGNFVELPCEAGVQMCISATGLGDTFASYSNFGTNAINVAAPGGDGPLPPPGQVGGWILGPCSSRVCGSIGGYVIATGTSASAPHVSGLAAYLFSVLGTQQNASQVITQIQQGADDIGKPGTDPLFGKGRINVFNTVVTNP